MSSCNPFWHVFNQITPSDHTFCIYNSDDQDVQVRMNHGRTVNDFVLKRHQHIILSYPHGEKNVPFSIITLNGQKHKISGSSISQTVHPCMHSLKEPCPQGLSQHKSLCCVCIINGKPYKRRIILHPDIIKSAEYQKYLDAKYLLDFMIKDINSIPEGEREETVKKTRDVGELEIRYIYYDFYKLP